MNGDLHDLTSLYALDLIEDDERARYEEHLAGCEPCRGELRGLLDAASALAFTEDAAPPPELRERILAGARAESSSNVVQLRPRRSAATTVAAVLAVAATVAAVGFGVWAARLHDSLTHARSATALLNDPTARHVNLRGTTGELVVSRTGTAVLAVSLPKLPRGKTYEAWVAAPSIARAGDFTGNVVTLSRRVPKGARVMVTVERSGGVDSPTHSPIVVAQA